MRNIIGLFIVFPLILLSCKKYEEGPLLSLKSKKERLANTWKVETALRNSEDISQEYRNYHLTFTKEGYFFVFYVEQSANSTIQGTWVLSNDKKEISTSYYVDTQTKTITYKILRLKENELYLFDIETNTELRFIPS